MYGGENQATRVSRVLFDQREIQLGNQIAGGNKTGIESARLKSASEKKAGAEQQHERKRNLCHDRDMTGREEAAETTNACRFADLLLEIVYQIGLCRFQRGAEAKKHGGDEAEQKSDGKDGRIRPQFNDE